MSEIKNITLEWPEAECIMCKEYCHTRGDKMAYKVDGVVFCSCCILWFKECLGKVTRELDLTQETDITLKKGEYIKLVHGKERHWEGFVPSKALFEMAEHVAEWDGAKPHLVRFQKTEIRLDFEDLSLAFAEDCFDQDPPDGYCPLKATS